MYVQFLEIFNAMPTEHEKVKNPKPHLTHIVAFLRHFLQKLTLETVFRSQLFQFVIQIFMSSQSILTPGPRIKPQ